MSKAKELRIGVIGCGGRGALAEHAHKPEEGVRLVAATDVVQESLDAFDAKYGPDCFLTKDYRELVARDDIDAVFVTTPDFLHEECAVAALEAGKSIYLEKPMAITVEGCDRILETAVRLKRKVYVGHNMRHMDFTKRMRDLIRAGAIGKVKVGWCRHFVGYGGDAYFKDWHAERSKSTSLLLQKGSHDIDILHWLCGGYTKRVNAMGGLTLYDRITDRHPPEERGNASWRLENWPPLSQKGLNPVIDVEDVSMMQMQFDNGVFASYQQCHYTPDGWRNYTIIGTEGRIENFGSTVVRLWNRRTHYNPYGDEQVFIPNIGGMHAGADPRIVDEFVRYVRDDVKITTSAVAARQAVAAGCMAAESLRNGGVPKEVPPLREDIVSYFRKDLAEDA